MLQTDRGTRADITDAALSKGKDDELPARFASAVTIAQPQDALFEFWKDFTNLPKFMENVLSVTPTGAGRTRWIVQGPSGDVDWESEITQCSAPRLIAWRSIGDSDIDHEGRVEFRPAPGRRGTEVRTFVRFNAPLGALGRLYAAIRQRDPHIQVRRDLRRFKQLMETGEVSTAVGPNVPPPKS